MRKPSLVNDCFHPHAQKLLYLWLLSYAWRHAKGYLSLGSNILQAKWLLGNNLRETNMFNLFFYFEQRVFTTVLIRWLNIGVICFSTPSDICGLLLREPLYFEPLLLFWQMGFGNYCSADDNNYKVIISARFENSCSAVVRSDWRINRSDPMVACLIILYACLMMNVPLYRVGIEKSIVLKLKQYRVVLIHGAKSKWGHFDTSLQDSSLLSNDTLSILALHW